MARFSVGNSFPSYVKLMEEISEFEKENFVNVSKKHSRTIENALKRGSNKCYNKGIVFAEVTFVCKHGLHFRQRPTKGVRPNTRTEKMDCPFSIKLRATADGQALFVTQFTNDHNHEISSEEFKLNPKQRKVDGDTEKEISKMIELNANRKMIQSHFAEKTGKPILMKDIHNIASRAKEQESKSCTSSPVQGLADWIKAEYPALKTHYVKDSNDIITGIFFQDPQMESAFQRFPEVILADATHKTNDQGMVLYTLLCIDGNGESQVAAVFLLQHEDEISLRKMVEIFKESNSRWKDMTVVMTDKDMTKRGVFKKELPQIHLEICLFHVLRTFGREVTCEKLGITSGDRSTVLEKIQEIAYAQDEPSYDAKYQELCSAMPNIVKNYYDKNWHTIMEQWVQGLKCTMNLCTRTNNRFESFFGKLKSCVTRRGSIQDLISGFVKVLCILRNERSHRLMKCLTTVPTSPILDEERPFQAYLTPYAFHQVQIQLQASYKVNIVGEDEVQTSTGSINTTSTLCECQFYMGMRLPCKHILALRRKQEEDLFHEDLFHERWSIAFYRSHRFLATNRAIVSVALQSNHKSRAMSEAQKHREVAQVLTDIDSCLTRSGTEVFRLRIEVLRELLSFWILDKEVFIGEHVRVQPEEDNNTQMESTDLDEVTIPDEASQDNMTSDRTQDAIPDEASQDNMTSDRTQDAIPDEASQDNMTSDRTQDDIPDEASQDNMTSDRTQDAIPDEASQDNMTSDRTQDAIPDDQSETVTDLTEVHFATRPKKRGRPKGSCTTAIGIPKRKKQKLSGKPQPFHRKDTTCRQKYILSFFVDEDIIQRVYSQATLIGEESIVMIPNEIPSAALDSHIDIRIIQKFFQADGWAALELVYNARKQLPWTCRKCCNELENQENSIGCTVTAASVGSIGAVRRSRVGPKLNSGTAKTVKIEKN